MKKEEIKITKGVTDIENIIKHLADEEKRAKKVQWLKENLTKRRATGDKAVS